MGYFFSGGGGGSTNDPTLPAGPLTFPSNADKISLSLTNLSSSVPAALEFSFSDDTKLVGVDPDHGTPQTPSYVVDPDNSPRTIEFVRGADDVSSGAATSITASYSTPSGPAGSISVEVSRGSVAEVVRAFATPTLEFANGLLGNAGSLGSGYDWSNPNSAVLSTSPRAARAVFGGSVVCSATGESLNTPAQDYLPFMRDTSQSRSWLIAYESDESGGFSDTNAYLNPYGRLGTSKVPGGLLYAGVSNDTLYYGYGSSRPLDNTRSHSDGGLSESLKINGTYQKLQFVALVWDHSASTLSTFWKSETHTRAGFSVYTDSSSAQTDVASYSIYLPGKGNSSSDARPLKTFYYSVLDHKMTQAEFQKVLTVARIG